MLPEPLHPAVVHFPIVLMVLVPVFAAFAIWSIRRGSDSRRTWAIPLFLSAALAGSTFVAVRTGEIDEDRVESVVSDDALDTHEEAAERFLVLSAVLLLIASAGLVNGPVGKAARALTLAGSVAIAVAGAQVGAAGGELVYTHNAGSAFSDPTVSFQRDSDD